MAGALCLRTVAERWPNDGRTIRVKNIQEKQTFCQIKESEKLHSKMIMGTKFKGIF